MIMNVTMFQYVFVNVICFFLGVGKTIISHFIIHHCIRILGAGDKAT